MQRRRGHEKRRQKEWALYFFGIVWRVWVCFCVFGALFVLARVSSSFPSAPLQVSAD